MYHFFLLDVSVICKLRDSSSVVQRVCSVRCGFFWSFRRFFASCVLVMRVQRTLTVADIMVRHDTNDM